MSKRRKNTLRGTATARCIAHYKRYDSLDGGNSAGFIAAFPFEFDHGQHHGTAKRGGVVTRGNYWLHPTKGWRKNRRNPAPGFASIGAFFSTIEAPQP